MADQNIFHIELRYNGHFKQIKRKKMIIHEGGRMRSLTVDYDRTCHMDFVEGIKQLLRWDENSNYRLLYAIPGSTPLVYTFINNDKYYMEMLQSHMKKRKCTIYTTVKMKRLLIRRMYNHTVLEKDIRQTQKDVELPHFVFEDEKWIKLLLGEEMNNEVLDQGIQMETVDSNLNNSKQSQKGTLQQNEEAELGDSQSTPRKLKNVKILQLPRRSPRFNQGLGDTSKTTQESEMKEFIEHGKDVAIENEDTAEDEMEDCYSQDTYHTLRSGCGWLWLCCELPI